MTTGSSGLTLAPIETRRLALAVAMAVFVAGLWLTRTYTAFTPVRFKIVEAPIAAASGVVTVSTRQFPDVRTLPAAAAIIARIRTDDAGARSLTLAVDGREVCTRSVRGRGSQRLDCASNAGWGPSGAHAITVSMSGAWSLEYLELATHHGNSFGFNSLFVVPSAAVPDRRPTLPGGLLLALAVGALFVVRPSYPRPRWLRRAVLGVLSLVTALAVAIAVAPLVSPFRVLLSTGTFLRWLGLVVAFRLFTTVRWLLTTRAPASAAARAVIVAGCVALVMSTLVRWGLNGPFHHNYSGFLTIQQARFDANPLVNQRDDLRRSLILVGEAGYDGQFMYFAALDPVLRAFRNEPQIYGRIFDQAPYRYGRVGFPLLARVLSLGDWRRLPATLVWTVVAGLFALAGIVAWAAERRGLSVLAGGLVLCIPGFWFSVKTGLPEPVAGALLVGGLVAFSGERLRLAGLLFAASLLVRETGLITVGAAALMLVSQRRLRQASEFAGLALAPLLAWRIYSGVILYPDWGARAFLFSAPAGLPFTGILTMWSRIGQGEYFPGYPSLAIAGTTFPLLLLAAGGLCAAMAWTAPGVAAVAGLVYSLSALTLRYDMVWLHIGNAERTTYEIFLMLLVSVLRIRSYPRWLQSALLAFWIAAGCYVLWGGWDSPHIRETLFPAFS